MTLGTMKSMVWRALDDGKFVFRELTAFTFCIVASGQNEGDDSAKCYSCANGEALLSALPQAYRFYPPAMTARSTFVYPLPDFERFTLDA